MTRQSTPNRNAQPKAGDRATAGARIPDKPRDCGPHVDTWPILDAQAGDAPKTKNSEQTKSK